MLPIGIISKSNRTYYYLLKELKSRSLPFRVIDNIEDSINFKVIIVIDDKLEFDKSLIKSAKIIELYENVDLDSIKKAVTMAVFYAKAAQRDSINNIVVGIDPGVAKTGLAVLIDGIESYKNIVHSDKKLFQEVEWISGISKNCKIFVFIGSGNKKIANKIKIYLQNEEIIPPSNIFLIKENNSNIGVSDADAALEIAFRGYQKLFLLGLLK